MQGGVVLSIFNSFTINCSIPHKSTKKFTKTPDSVRFELYIPITWCPWNKLHEWLQYFFFLIPLLLLNRCGALILGFLIGNKPFGLYPFLHVHFISSYFNVWFRKICILPVLNIPQLSASRARFLWLLSTHILLSPSVCCFRRRSVKSSSS